MLARPRTELGAYGTLTGFATLRPKSGRSQSVILALLPDLSAVFSTT